jgi:predicted nucleic acid-binding protein
VTTSEITLAEVLVMPLRDGKPQLAAIYEELLSPDGPVEMVPLSRDILVRSAQVRSQSSAKPVDALHIATAMAASSVIFLSDDRRLNPAPIRKLTLEELVNA